jgi:hypothetical protein
MLGSYLPQVLKNLTATLSLFILRSCFTHALLMLYSCFTHALLMLYSYLPQVLDNLTTTIVVVSLLGTLVPKEEIETRRLLGGLAVVAANAGGA